MAGALVSAQMKPEAGTSGTLYTAESDTVLSSVRACNVATRTDYITIRRVFGGEPASDKQLLCSATPIPPGLAFSVVEGVTLLPEESIVVESRLGTTAFNLSGAETE